MNTLLQCTPHVMFINNTPIQVPVGVFFVNYSIGEHSIGVPLENYTIGEDSAKYSIRVHSTVFLVRHTIGVLPKGYTPHHYRGKDYATRIL